MEQEKKYKLIFLTTIYHKSQSHNPKTFKISRIIMAAKQAAEKLISSHKVAVFSKTYCPYCSKTKSTLQGLNVPNVGILELDTESNGSDIQAYLKDKTGQNSVPNVFINGKHIGGNSDLQELHSKGELQKLIAA